MSLYADTSVLISYYINDANSVRAQTLIHAMSDPLVFTGLHRLEMRNALSLGIFRKLLSPAQVQAAWNNITMDLRAGRLVPKAVNWPPIFRVSAELALRHTPTVGSRSLDVLHVACGQWLGTIDFLSFDSRQSTLAKMVGMTVKH